MRYNIKVFLKVNLSGALRSDRITFLEDLLPGWPPDQNVTPVIIKTHKFKWDIFNLTIKTNTISNFCADTFYLFIYIFIDLALL